MKKTELQINTKSTTTLIGYLREKGKKHYCYKYYSNLSRIENNFISNKCLYLTNGENWNDIRDYNRFNPHDSDSVRYGMCFSFSKSENVSMWMLYGGMKNKGAMIDLSQSFIKKIVNETKNINIGFFDGDKGFKSNLSLSKSNFKIDIQDVLYFGRVKDESKYSANDVYIKRSDQSLDGVNSNIINNYDIIRKTVSWSYENETRLYVSVPRRLISEGINTVVRISFPWYRDELSSRIVLAPNYVGDNNSGYKRSCLTGEMNWNLCKDCDKEAHHVNT